MNTPVDMSLFGAFRAAAETLSFTEAAKKTHVTQSAISQQISRLESQMQVPLFERVNKKILLTEAGRKLFQFSVEHEESFERFMDDFQQSTQTIAGKVTYAMPQSCLFSPHFPQLLKKRKKTPRLYPHLYLCHNEGVIEKLLKQEIDFGFVTSPSQNPAVIHHEFVEEKYVLVASRNFERNSLKTVKDLHEIPFISYQGMGALFDHWKQAHFPSAKKLGLESFNLVGSINSIHGAIMMVEEELGCGVFPEHCVEKSLQSGKIKIVKGPAIAPLTNKIYIVTLQPKSKLLARVRYVIDLFFEMKKA